MSHPTRLVPAVFAVVLAPLIGALSFAQNGADDDRAERLADGQVVFRDNCLMCHAEDMVVRSRLTEKQWAAEIDKMMGWGAPVPPASKGVLLEYLVSHFSDPKATPVPPPQRITLREAEALTRPETHAKVEGDMARGATLYAMNCATCHGPDARGGDLGTCLVEKPVLLRPTEFAHVVRQGLRRMPGFQMALKPEAEADILAWLRTRRFELSSSQ